MRIRLAAIRGPAGDQRQGFTSLFSKLVLLGTNEDIPIGEQYLLNTGATFAKTTAQTVSAPGDPFVERTFPTVVTDPSATYTGTGRYTAPFTMDSEPTLKINIQGTFLNGIGGATITVQLFDFTTAVSYSEKVYTITSNTPSFYDE